MVDSFLIRNVDTNMSTANIQNSTEKSSFQNPIAVAMQKRYGHTTTVMRDRRTKRQNRRSWRKDQEV